MARTREWSEQPIEVLPGIWSHDPLFLKFLDQLSRSATKMFPEMTDEWGRLHGNGVPGNFFGLRHITGFAQLPATWPLMDNRELRASKGLSNSFQEEWHENLFRAIVRLFHEDIEAVPLKLRRQSSSTAPFFTKDLNERLDIVRFSLMSGEKAGHMMLKGDYEGAFSTYHIGGAYYVVYRLQTNDSVIFNSKTGEYISKQREVADLLYATSKGKKGRLFPSDKEMGDVDFWVPKGFFRARKRTAMGGPLAMGAALMPVAQAVRAGIYEKFAYTFHHTTREAQQDGLKDWVWSFAADVSQHDQYWPTFVLPVIKDELSKIGFKDWWLELYETKSHLPLYVTGVGPNEPNLLLGDWRKPDLHCGLPSGNPYTDLEGTMVMTWVYAMIQIDHTEPRYANLCKSRSGAYEFAKQYMLGQLPIALKDKSDDALLGWKEPHQIAAARELQAKAKRGDQLSPYMLVTYEHGGGFLGNLLLYPKDFQMQKMVLIGNILSYFNRQFTPEYGVSSQQRDRTKVRNRPYPGLAWESLDTVYGSSPVYGEAKELIEQTWRDVFGYSYKGFRDDLLRHDKRQLANDIERMTARAGNMTLSAIDAEVIASPDKLEYKFLKGDVSPEVYSLLYTGLSTDFTGPYLDSIIN